LKIEGGREKIEDDTVARTGRQDAAGDWRIRAGD
jgi:hypothetical protein